jgi:hypothetical protein
MNENDYTNANKQSKRETSGSSKTIRRQQLFDWTSLVDINRSSGSSRVFVELSLQDGTGRSWCGFRQTKLVTHQQQKQDSFVLEWKLDELVSGDMEWKEGRDYCDKYLKDYYRSRTAREELTKLMERIQLTVRLDDALIFASGGCAGDVYCLSPAASFHHQDDDNNTYRASMCLIGESPSFGSSNKTARFQKYKCGSQLARRQRRRLASMGTSQKNRKISITIQRAAKSLEKK